MGCRHAQLLVLCSSLALSAAPAVPPGRLGSVAVLPDGRTALVVPTERGLELRATAHRHPRTLADFGNPVLLLGAGGTLGRAAPANALLAVAADALQLFFTAEGRLHAAATPLPLAPDGKWRAASQPLPGELRLRLTSATGGRPTVLVRQHEAGQTGSRLHRATLDPAGTLVVQEVTRGADYVAAADAFVARDGELHVVWSEAAPEQPIRYGVFAPEGRPRDAPVTLLDAGQQPVIAAHPEGAVLASEAPGGGINLWWLVGREVRRTEKLVGRMSLRPSFARDAHGVTWLFALDADRRALWYRRLLGRDFSAEQTAYGVQGRWQHDFALALPPRLDASAPGLPILHHEDLPEGGADRFRFDLLPVPRLSARDSRRVLFLDLLDVAELDNALLRLGVANKLDTNPLPLNGPAGSADEAWAQYADVMHDAGRFRMWYTTNTNTFERNWNLAYAESADGLRWEKPALGIAEWNGSKANNLLFPNFADPAKPPVGFNAGVGCVVRDDAEPDPARRYKMIFMSGVMGGDAGSIYLTWSVDGLHWHLPPQLLWGKAPGPNQTIRAQTPWVEPLSSFFRDPLEPHPNYRWKLYGIDAYGGHPHMDVNTVRSLGVVAGATPDALRPWPFNPVLDPRTGMAEDQNHGGCVQVYEGIYVSLYQHWSGPDWNIDLRLATSRDGLHFTRVFPAQPLLPRGPPGAWDAGALCTPNSLITHAGQLWLYYRGSNGTLATGRALSRSDYAPAKSLREPWRISTGLARLRQDGFTYLTVAPLRRRGSQFRTNFVTDYDVKLEARVRSIPIDAAGIDSRTLHVNAGTLAPRFAWLKAQLRDAATGEVIPGFAFADCDALEEDRLDHTFTWRGSASLAAVRAARVQVEFLLFGMLDSPRLHSFWFE